MFPSVHIWTKQQFTSLALLLRLSFLGTIRDIDIFLSLDFNESASSIIDLAIWLAIRSEFRLLVPQWRIIWSGIKSRTVGFTWSWMHLTFAELNGSTLTRHLVWVFLSIKNHLISLPFYLLVWTQFLLNFVMVMARSHYLY